MILRHAFTPLNNQRLTHLCGPADHHLRSIEMALQVRIEHRHEHFKIDGPKKAAHRAMEVLQAVYEIADRTVNAETLQLMLAGDAALREADDGSLVLQTRRSDLRARTPNQSVYLNNITQYDITFGIGPAGTGKTYLAVACAVDALERNAVQKIVLTRPAVEAGERLGFLPGDLTQKVDPYLRPLYDALYELMGFERVQKAFERNALEIAPLAFMRGRTLNNAFVILDEAQNTTPEQMKMFLTRIGFGARAVITGDISQIDLPKHITSGLVDAERVLRKVQGIAFTRFNSGDVVRHPLVARIVDAYDSASGNGPAKPPVRRTPRAETVAAPVAAKVAATAPTATPAAAPAQSSAAPTAKNSEKTTAKTTAKKVAKVTKKATTKPAAKATAKAKPAATASTKKAPAGKKA